MDLALTEHQELLKNTAADFMHNECPLTVLLEMDNNEGTALAQRIWRQAATVGWQGMAIPTEYGGAGSPMLDIAVVFEQFGRGPLPGPYFSSGVLSALLVQELGTMEQQRDLLPGMADGSLVLLTAIRDPQSSWGPRGVQVHPTLRGGSFHFTAVKPYVHNADMATHFAVALRTGGGDDGISFVLVDAQAPGVSIRRLTGFLTDVFEVRFDNVTVPSSALLGDQGNGWSALERALERALPVLGAYQTGGCMTVFDMSVKYSQTRIQFAQPIGRFQRVQDHIIYLVNHLDAARWTTYEALWKLDTGRPAAGSVHLSKAVASEGYYQACNYAHEVHAGIGIAREYGLTLHSRMSRTLYQYLGDPSYHKHRLADYLPE